MINNKIIIVIIILNLGELQNHVLVPTDDRYHIIRQESFMSLSIPVGETCSNLHESFHQLLDDINIEFSWKDLDNIGHTIMQPTVRRINLLTCPSEYLILSLRRFEFDINTSNAIKIIVNANAILYSIFK